MLLRPEVIVVGAGPTGLALCALLGALDVATLLLEQRSALPLHPQAHFINHRTMEIFRPMDALAESVTRRTPPLREWRKFVYSQSLSGGVFGEMDHFEGQRTALRRFSPEPVAHLSQNKLMPLMLERAQRLKNVRVEFQSEVVACEAMQRGTRVKIKKGNSVQTLESRFAVLANGANSELVQKLGIKFQGLEELSGVLQNLLSVHFHSRQLGRKLSANPAMLYFVFNSRVVLVVVVHNLEDGEFVAQIPFFPPLQQSSDFGEKVCKQLIHYAAGSPLDDVKIETIRPWIMKAQVADTFQKDSIFLIGDAGHVFPPAGGFGMNTGIQVLHLPLGTKSRVSEQDAHNLGWKLAAVVKGLASEELLQTYTKERRPVVIQNSLLSLKNWKEASAVPAALGLNPSHATMLSDAVSGTVGKLLPQTIAKSFLEAGLGLGRGLSGLQGPLKAWRQQRLSEIFRSRQSLRLQYPREDLGFVYSTNDPSDGHADLYHRSVAFVPSVVVGGRLPHAVIRLQGSGRNVSSLDFVSWSRLRCTAWFVGYDRKSCLSILRSLSDSNVSDVVNAVLLQSKSADAQHFANSEASEFIPFVNLCDLHAGDFKVLAGGMHLFQGADPSGMLTHSREIKDVFIVIVRPDGHVSSILKSPTYPSLHQAIQQVFAMHSETVEA